MSGSPYLRTHDKQTDLINIDAFNHVKIQLGRHERKGFRIEGKRCE